MIRCSWRSVLGASALALALVHLSARAQSDGTLDPTFGNGGLKTVFFDLPGGGTRQDIATDVAIQPDGKIVVVGQADFDGAGDTDIAVARLLPNGTLDTSFDGDGKRTVLFDLGGDKADQAFAVALQADGKIVVAGRARGADGRFDPALVRLLSNGDLDTTFGTGGKLTIDLSSGPQDGINAVTVLSGGKILIAGRMNDRGFLARLLSNGAIDVSTFANFGVVEVQCGAADYRTVQDLAVQTDGKIVVVGTKVSGTNQEALHQRFVASGAPDPDWAACIIRPTRTARAVAPRSGGQNLIGSTLAPLSSDPRVLVSLVMNDGNFDASFPGSNGRQFGSGVDSVAGDLKLTRDGKILIFGWANLLGGEFAVLRLNSNGTIDPLFDRNPEWFGNPGDGRVIINHYALGPALNEAGVARMALVDRGRAILVGTVCRLGDCDTTADSDFMIQRLNVRNDILVDSFE